ncbi:hypothetical protein C1H46_044131 [Malus baccata]|uniref:Uncharacterized protein n=1 Tax=Malus baccata TaxID=106549 RepID=A0A540K7X7_MALBA|nr:hypothetical protein C1H46_044131 [Malus baccata]
MDLEEFREEMKKIMLAIADGLGSSPIKMVPPLPFPFGAGDRFDFTSDFSGVHPHIAWVDLVGGPLPVVSRSGCGPFWLVRLGFGVWVCRIVVPFLVSFPLFRFGNNSSKAKTFTHNSSAIPNVSEEIQEIRIDDLRNNPSQPDPKPINHQSHPDPVVDSDSTRAQPLLLKQDDHHESPAGSGGRQRIHIEIGKDHQISYPEKGGGGGSSHGSGEARSGDQGMIVAPEV